jgi:diguanylate cyclase (GGDEF)-like protein
VQHRAVFGRTTDSVTMTSSSTSGILDVATILKASQALSQEIVMAHLLKRLMQVALEGAGAQRGVLLLKNEATWFLEAEKSEAQTEAAVLQSIALNVSEPEKMPLPIALFNYVVRTRESIVVHDATRDKLLVTDPYVLTRKPRSLLIVPILHHADLIGILYLENNAASGAFTQSRLEMLRLLASQAAISIDNARLYAEMEERVAARTAELKNMALRDGLTGVSNRRAFDERLAEELGRSRRSGQPLALLIIDIDHFKQVNDRFGHPVGDSCLQRVGAMLLAQCRRSADFVARYGGEEFAMILPDTDMGGAAAFAERVRTAIQGIVLEVGPTLHPITASIGIANTESNALTDVAALVAIADRGLYAAKAAGRNCVVSADCEDVVSR